MALGLLTFEHAASNFRLNIGDDVFADEPAYFFAEIAVKLKDHRKYLIYRDCLQSSLYGELSFQGVDELYHLIFQIPQKIIEAYYLLTSSSFANLLLCRMRSCSRRALFCIPKGTRREAVNEVIPCDRLLFRFWNYQGASIVPRSADHDVFRSGRYAEFTVVQVRNQLSHRGSTNFPSSGIDACPIH